MSDTLDRREFLKLSSLGLGSLPFRRLLTNQAVEESRYSLPIKFVFDYHTLSPQMITPSTALVMGETDVSYLAWRRLGKMNEDRSELLKRTKIEQLLERFRYHVLGKKGGFGASDEEIELQNAVLIQLKEKGIELVATDHVTMALVNTEYLDQVLQKLRKIKARSSFLAGGITGTVGLSTFLAANKFWPATKAGAVSVLSTAATAVGLESKSTSQLMEVLANDTEDRIVNAFFDARDKNMAYNMKFVEALLTQNLPLQKRVGLSSKDNNHALVFAASGHKKVKSHYEKEIDKLGDEIKREIIDNIDYATNMIRLLGDGLIEEMTEENFLNLWSFITISYSFPIASFYEYDDYKNIAPFNQISTPREFLWYELLKKFTSGEASQKASAKLIDRLAKQDLALFGSKERGLPEINSMVERMLTQRKRGETQEIPLYRLIETENPESRPVLVFSEGVPFVMNASDLD